MRIIRVAVTGLLAAAAGFILVQEVCSVIARGQSVLLYLGVTLLLGIVGFSFGKALRDWVEYREATQPSRIASKAFKAFMKNRQDVGRLSNISEALLEEALVSYLRKYKTIPPDTIRGMFHLNLLIFSREDARYNAAYAARAVAVCVECLEEGGNNNVK